MSNSTEYIIINTDNIMEVHRGGNLIMDVPPEILTEYFNHLDVKSSIMFAATCKRTMYLNQPHVIDDIEVSQKPTFIKTVKGLGSIITSYVNVLKSMYETVTAEESRNHMMANLLRKLIYTSVSNANHHVETASAVAFEQCRTEYQNLTQYFSEQMDLNSAEFNILLEDAQFEFRGCSIINMTDENRRILDTFKSTLKSVYFNGPYTVQANVQYEDTCFEIYFDGESIVFDIHHHQNDDDNSPLIFFQDNVDEWIDTASGKLKEAYDKAEICIEHNRLQWPISSIDAPNVIAELIIKFMPNPLFYKGGDDVDTEVWNHVLEENWLLNEVVCETMNVYGYDEWLKHASCEITEAYSSIH